MAGSMTYASPGPISTSVTSSCLTPIRPEWATPTWRAWQLSVPATGLMHSDHRHPGSNVNRAAVVAPMRTTSTCVLSGVRVSSGDSKSRVSTPATAISSRRSMVTSRAIGGRVTSEAIKTSPASVEVVIRGPFRADGAWGSCAAPPRAPRRHDGCGPQARPRSLDRSSPGRTELRSRSSAFLAPRPDAPVLTPRVQRTAWPTGPATAPRRGFAAPGGADPRGCPIVAACLPASAQRRSVRCRSGGRRRS